MGIVAVWRIGGTRVLSGRDALYGGAAYGTDYGAGYCTIMAPFMAPTIALLWHRLWRRPWHYHGTTYGADYGTTMAPLMAPLMANRLLSDAYPTHYVAAAGRNLLNAACNSGEPIASE